MIRTALASLKWFMSEKHTIGRVALYVEIGGEVTLVTMSQEKLKSLVHIAAALCENGVLPVAKKADSKFSTHGEWRAVTDTNRRFK